MHSHFSIVWLFATYGPPGFSVHRISQARILEWVPFPSPGDVPDPGIEPSFLMSPALADDIFTTSTPGEHLKRIDVTIAKWHILLLKLSSLKSNHAAECTVKNINFWLFFLDNHYLEVITWIFPCVSPRYLYVFVPILHIYI